MSSSHDLGLCISINILQIELDVIHLFLLFTNMFHSHVINASALVVLKVSYSFFLLLVAFQMSAVTALTL